MQDIFIASNRQGKLASTIFSLKNVTQEVPIQHPKERDKT